ncbi:hypothetical protein H8E77_41760 [bacterium]|nr:hypothetical protein [bacterium]
MDKQNPKFDYLEGTHFHRAKKASIRYGNVPKPYYGCYFRSARSNRFTKNTQERYDALKIAPLNFRRPNNQKSRKEGE